MLSFRGDLWSRADFFFFRRFHEADSLRADPLEWTDFFFLDFHEVFGNETRAMRCNFRSSFFEELFLDERRTDFWSFHDEVLFFRDELFFWTFTERCKFQFSHFFFHPVPKRWTFGRSFLRLLFTQLPENCSFIGRVETFILWMESRRFLLKSDDDWSDDVFRSEVMTFSEVNEQ